MPNESSVLVRLRLLGGARFAAEAKGASGGLRSLDRTAGAATSRLRGIAGVSRTAGRIMRGTLVGGSIAAASALGAIGQQTIGFDESMRNVNSIAQVSEGRLASLGKQVRELGARTAQAPKTLADGLYTLVSSGFDARQSLTILRSSARAATAGLTDTATSTQAVAAVLNAYHLPARAAGKVSDQLFRTVDRGVISFEQLAENVGDVLPFASSLGVGLDQVGASIATMTKAGISAPETMTRIKAAMTTLLKPGAALQGTLKRLGYESGEALIKQKGFQGTLDVLAKAAGGSKAGLAKLFPNVRALGAALALTGKNSRGANEDLAGLGKSSRATGRALSQQSKSVAYQWRKLKAEAASMAIDIGTKLVPAALKGLRAVSKFGRQLFAGLQGAGGGGAAGKIGATIRSTVGPVIGWVQKNLPKVGAIVQDVASQLIGAFKPAAPFLQNVLLPLLKGVAIGVIGSVVVAFKVLVPLIKIVATAFGFVGKVLAPFKGVIQGVGMVIGFLAAGPILKLLGGLGKLGVVFRVLAAPVRLASSVFKLLFGVIGRVVGIFLKAHLAALRFVATFASAPARLARAALNMVGSVIGVIERFPGRLFNIGKDAVGKLLKGLGSIGQRLGSIKTVFGRVGKAIVDAIIDTIKSAPGAIAGAITSVVPGPVRGAVGKALGLAKSINPFGATGGTIQRSGWAVIGERGPELAKLPRGTTVYDADQTARARSGVLSPAAPIYLTANLHLSGRQIHHEVFRIDRQQREAM